MECEMSKSKTFLTTLGSEVFVVWHLNHEVLPKLNLSKISEVVQVCDELDMRPLHLAWRL